MALETDRERLLGLLRIGSAAPDMPGLAVSLRGTTLVVTYTYDQIFRRTPKASAARAPSIPPLAIICHRRGTEPKRSAAGGCGRERGVDPCLETVSVFGQGPFALYPMCLTASG